MQIVRGEKLGALLLQGSDAVDGNMRRCHGCIRLDDDLADLPLLAELGSYKVRPVGRGSFIPCCMRLTMLSYWADIRPPA